jgi:hypothetical protein
MTSDALTETVADFTGRGPGGGGGGGFITIDPDVLGPDSTTSHRLVADRSIGWRRSAAIDLGQGWQVRGAGTLALGQSRHDLPEGMGVLTDPARIAVTSLSVQPELGLARQFDLGPATVTAGASVGLQVSRNRVTVRSALLDVTSHSVTTAPYALASVEVQPQDVPGTLAVEARVHGDGSSQIRAEVRLHRPR